jgi:hypothetical protein
MLLTQALPYRSMLPQAIVPPQKMMFQTGRVFLHYEVTQILRLKNQVLFLHHVDKRSIDLLVLITALSTLARPIRQEKRNFSDEDPEQSPRTVRRSIYSDTNPIRLSHKEDVGDSLEDDVDDSLEDDIGDANEISEHLDTYITDVVKNSHEKRFDNAIKAEMAGLLCRDVFELVSESSVSFGRNNMGSKLYLVVKNSETTQPVYKARLVIFKHQR